MYEQLRILDFTSCAKLSDRAVEKIISVAPRLRNLVLAKCKNITDAAVNAICALGKNLHYLHLGHCGNITDASVKSIVRHCGRIRYIDLGCCTRLTDDSVMQLAQLPKLRRIGLVKCNLITDDSVYALAHVPRLISTANGGEPVILPRVYGREQSSLERVHLSYCARLTLKVSFTIIDSCCQAHELTRNQSIETLLNQCPRLTHLSLTGVDAFLREDLNQFCREAPDEFNAHQRQVFCVFSGPGVTGLRKYLNEQRALREATRASGGPLADSDGEMFIEPEDDDDDATMTGLMAASALDNGSNVAVAGDAPVNGVQDQDVEDYVVLSSAATPTNANP